MNRSRSGKITEDEIVHWFKWSIVFASPALIAILTALQTGGDIKFALGAGYSALLSSLIGLVKTIATDNRR